MTVRELLAQYEGVRACVLPNPGNAGDGLIHRGLRRLCAAYGLSVTELYYDQPAFGELLLASGAGNLCVPYHGVVDRIAPYAPFFRTVVVLPCSVDLASPEVSSFVRTLPANAHLFCREAQSYAAVREALGPERNVWLDHDLAFEADVDPWRGPGRGTLYAFREDAEAASGPLPPENYDVSRDTGEYMSDLLLDVVSAHETVYTDRAHVAIAAAMLGRTTHVYPNAYHKVRGIYAHSLSRFPHVRFHESREALPTLDFDPRIAIWRARLAAERAPEPHAAHGFA